MSLERAVAAKEGEARLAALLAAWRKKKHPRIADLIDRVSAPLVAAAGPVAGASVPARVKACVALLAKEAPVDVGRVLAWGWPGSWDAALPLVKALAALPDDPRVAKEFARQVDLRRYESLASRALWLPLFRRLAELGDVRQRDLLAAQAQRAKGQSWAKAMARLEATALQRLAAVKVPALTARDEERLSTLEATLGGPFGSVARESAKSGEALLAAVYANPGDLAVRAVYGDWIAQQGEPRGELIALQLGAPSEKAEAKVRALVKKHWQAWVGPLGDWFVHGTTRAKQVPTFKAGFAWSVFVGAPQHAAEDKLRALLDRPEWRTVEVLEDWPEYVVPLHEALAHPNLGSVRVLKQSLVAGALNALSAVRPPLGLEEVHVNLYRDEALALELPSLKRVVARATELPKLVDVLPRLEQVSFDAYYASELTTERWALLERSGVAAVDVGLFVVSRARGAKHFETLLVREARASAHLERVPATLTTFAEGQPVLAGDGDALSALRDVLARRFSGLDVTKLGTQPDFKAPAQTHVHVELNHMTPLFAPAYVARVLAILTDDFGATFDTFQINRNIDRPLGADRLVKLQTWAKNERATSLTLLRKGSETTVTVHADAPFCTLTLPLLDVDRFLAALRKFVELGKARSVRAAYVEVEADASWKPIEKALRKL